MGDVLKQGSHWQGVVTKVDAQGNVVTNFKTDEVRPFAESSKMWIEFEKTGSTVRGLSDLKDANEPGRLMAVEGRDGFLEIVVPGESAAAQTHLVIGDRVDIYFRS